jgi:pimeloyl-ACP methyl ester carboxylesterase
MATRRIDVGEVRLAVAEAGEGGEPVILLHGFPEMAHSWRHQLPALADAGFHAIAPDLRGYGDSDRPPAVDDYAAPKLAGDIVGLITALGHERAHLVGHDWGGSLAWALAARAPEVVRTLSALNAPHPVASSETRQEPEQQQKAWYMLLFNFPGVAEAWLSKDDFANLRRFVFDTAAPEAFPPEDRERFVAALARDGALTAALNWYRANIPPSSWLSPPPDMPPVTVPTMVVWGEADAYMGEPVLQRSMQKVTGPLRLERLPGVSHWVQQEAPDAVNALLLDFLGAHREGGG